MRITNADPCYQASDDSFQPLVIDDIEQLERRPPRMSFTLFPLTYSGSGGMQVEREHRLTEFQPFAQSLDVGGTELPHRWREERIELAHLLLADHSRGLERGQVATKGFNDPAHNAPLIALRTAML